MLKISHYLGFIIYLEPILCVFIHLSFLKI